MPKTFRIAGATALAAAALALVPTAAHAADSGPGAVRGLAGKCLDVRAGGSANGTPVQLYTCNGSGAQQWTYGETPGVVGGTVKALGKCLDVASSGTADRTAVQLWDCNDSGAQKWVYAEGGVLVNPQSSKCLDVPGGNAADGTQLQIYTCNYTDAQKWSRPSGGGSTTPPAGTLQQQVLDLVNNYRAQNGKPALQYDPALTHTAQDEADEEARRGQQGHWAFGHIYESLKAYGYTHGGGAAENAAGYPGFWKDARSVVQAWIDEPGHRQIMLGDYKYTGVGVTVVDGNYWWAQDFAG
ncbi:CAP domain-containing protein [Streptomyces olivoreticuli]|uniref:CAP domain-containing protein n=1 Tax=Streptomyces olivoreticuli TaxID=68246 RepID=UPI000E2699C7|nr:ricin-type beta-trefoil lectin domain protein [Streptomyces olivoreticuli]